MNLLGNGLLCSLFPLETSLGYTALLPCLSPAAATLAETLAAVVFRVRAPTSVQLAHPPAASEETPLALEHLDHHQPSHLVPTPEAEVAGFTYSLLVTPGIVQDAVRALTPRAGPSEARRTLRAHASTVPALSRDDGRKDLERLRGTSQSSFSCSSPHPAAACAGHHLAHEAVLNAEAVKYLYTFARS